MLARVIKRHKMTAIINVLVTFTLGVSDLFQHSLLFHIRTSSDQISFSARLLVEDRVFRLRN